MRPVPKRLQKEISRRLDGLEKVMRSAARDAKLIEGALKEIDRWAGHPRVVQLVMNRARHLRPAGPPGRSTRLALRRSR